MRLLLLVTALLWTGSTVTAQTTLTAMPGTPDMDGVISDGEWASDPLVTTGGVTLYSMADGENLYLAARWADDTENTDKSMWEYDGSAWVKGPGNEDRFSFIWDMGLNGADGPSCTTMCHGDGKMRTNNGLVDVWHWKAARGNGVGFADDKYWNTEDRQSDPGTKAYVDNKTESGLPAFMASSDPDASLDFLAADADALAAWDPFGTMASHTVAAAVLFDSTIAFATGSKIPYYALRPAEGDRGTVQSAGKWEDGFWTVEFRRPYPGGAPGKTQSEFDFDVVPGTTIDFTHESFDNTGGSHPNDGFDGTVYTLDLNSIPAASGTTSLVASSGTPDLDGMIGDGEWTSNALVTTNGVTLYSMADGENLYLAARWADDTENTDKSMWEYDGSAWVKGPGNEDRFSFIWDMGLNGSDGPSCTTMCHGDGKMRTNNGLVDVWHWKAARGNGVGFADDKYWDTEDRQSDPGTKAYVDNAANGKPIFMAASDPDASVDFLAVDAGALAAWDPFGTMASHTVAEAVAFDSTIAFAAGSKIPYYALRPAVGDRGSVESAGMWKDGVWTVEFRKPYVGGASGKVASEFDFDVIPGTTIDFTHESFDNTGGSHPNDGFDGTVYTLDLGGIPVATPTETNLIAASGMAMMDGVIGPGEYTAPPLVTANDVTLYAMGDGEFLYLAAHWKDETENTDKSMWEYDGSAWVKGPGNEDRFSFIWDMGLNGTDRASCTTMCHGDGKMRTNNGLVDVWHWKAARGNGVGFADDKYWDTEDRQSDPGTKSYVDNKTESGLPAFMAANDPDASVDFLATDATALAAWDPFGTMASHTVAEAVAFDSTIAFATGSKIPYYTLQPAAGDRGSVQTAGMWKDGWWTVEFKKPYAGGDPGKVQSEFDFDVVPGTTVEFTHEIFDNTGGSHPNDGLDGTVYTLDLSGLVTTATEAKPGDIPTSFALRQNYPNPFNPSTAIEFQVADAGRVKLAVFDALGKHLTTLADEDFVAGTYSLTYDATGLPSGVYFYRLEANGFLETRVMTLLK